MSLALLSGYSSAEDDAAEDDKFLYLNSSSDEADDHPHPPAAAARNSDGSFSFVSPNVSNASGLPSALDAFSEVSGPPAFLNNSVEEDPSARAPDQPPVHAGRRRRRKDKKDVPASAVLEAKAQLVGIHERVRSDVEGSQPAATVTSATQGGKRVATATNPKAEDAAELLRMCLQCGIPKTFSNARGMVCPVCSDRPPADNTQESKKKGSMIKDKEKNKRMKGQSSHATWKSETEMHLRQQFD